MPPTTPVQPDSRTVAQRNAHVDKWKQYADWADAHEDVDLRDLTMRLVRDGRLPPEWISFETGEKPNTDALADWVVNGPEDGVYGQREDGTFELAYFWGRLYRTGDYVAVVRNEEWIISEISGFVRSHTGLPKAALTALDEQVLLPVLTTDLENCLSPPTYPDEKQLIDTADSNLSSAPPHPNRGDHSPILRFQPGPGLDAARDESSDAEADDFDAEQHALRMHACIFFIGFFGALLLISAIVGADLVQLGAFVGVVLSGLSSLVITHVH